MTITLTDESQRLVDRSLQRGRFATADQVVTAALEALRERDEEDDLLAAHREQIADGVRELDAGLSRPVTDSVIEEWKAGVRSRREAAGRAGHGDA